MATRKQSKGPQPQGMNRSGAGKEVPKALPKGRTGRPDTGEPGGGQGRVDITGTMPNDIRVDPNITQGHPGYQESGDSEIIPSGRLKKRGGE